MTQCAYMFEQRIDEPGYRVKPRCLEPAYEGSDLCILHIPFPEHGDERIDDLKEAKVAEKVKDGDFDFKGAKLRFFGQRVKGVKPQIKGDLIFSDAYVDYVFDLSDATIGGSAYFRGATIDGITWFNDATIEGGVLFDDATIEDLHFYSATIKGSVWFIRTTVNGRVGFAKATIRGGAFFRDATILGDVGFPKATILGNVEFGRATIRGGALFGGALLEGRCDIADAQIHGTLDFTDTQFRPSRYHKKMTNAHWQNKEEACRKAKQVWDGRGDRRTADDYFYREMEARRKQKPFYERWLELPAQYVFGYGVHPERLFAAFVIALTLFGTFYWLAGLKGFFESLYFSFTTMLIPGSAIASPQPGIIGLVLVAQSLFGILVWGTFIATLTRKFGR